MRARLPSPITMRMRSTPTAFSSAMRQGSGRDGSSWRIEAKTAMSSICRPIETSRRPVICATASLTSRMRPCSSRIITPSVSEL